MISFAKDFFFFKEIFESGKYGFTKKKKNDRMCCVLGKDKTINFKDKTIISL